MSTQPLILRNKSWRYLIREFEHSPRFSFILGKRREMIEPLLAAPAAIALFLVKFAPELAQRSSPLRLLVVGAQHFDVIDDMCWYQAIPDLAGGLFPVEVTAIGDEIEPFRTALYPEVSARYRKGIALEGTVEDHITDCSNYDLIILFQPGFEMYKTKWKPAIDMFVASGKPIMATAFAADEFDQDSKYLIANGYTVNPAVEHNPFYLHHDFDHDRISLWASEVWEIKPVPVPEGFEIDTQMLDDLDNMSKLGADSFMKGLANTLLEPCERTTLRDMTTGKDFEVVHVMDHFFVKPTTGEIFVMHGINENGRAPVEQQMFYRLEKQLLDTLPEESAPRFDRLAWASRVKQRVMDEYEAKGMSLLNSSLLDAPDALDFLEGVSPEQMDAAMRNFAQKRQNAIVAEQTPQVVANKELFRLLQDNKSNQVAEMVINSPALVREVGPDGWTPLTYAVAHGNLQLVECLLAHGADVNWRDDDGWTPVMEGVRRGFAQIVKRLLGEGADPNLTNADGFNTAHFAGLSLNREIVRLVKESGANFKVRNKNGQTGEDQMALPDFVKEMTSKLPMRIPRLKE